MSLRTDYAALLVLLQEAQQENERAQEARRRMLRCKQVLPQVRDTLEMAAYASLRRLKHIRREIVRIDAVYARHEANKAAGKAAKLAVETAQRQEFKRARAARRQERKRAERA